MHTSAYPYRDDNFADLHFEGGEKCRQVPKNRELT